MSKSFSKALLNEYIPKLIKLWKGKNLKNPERSSLNKNEITSVAQSLLKLQRGLTGDKHLAGAGYMQDNFLLGAYLLYYWPVSFLQLLTICADAEKKMQEIYITAQDETLPIRILDLGCGPGAACCAILSFFSRFGEKKINSDVYLSDSSPKALDIAEKLVESNPHSDNIFVEKSVDNLEDRAFFDSFADKKFDVIVMSHSLNELWKNDVDKIEKRIDFIENCINHLTENGVVIINEPSVLDTSRALLETRNGLVKRGAHIVCPCICNAECPALIAGPNHTCHCENAWNVDEIVSAISKEAKLDRESVKMTYFVFERKSNSVCELEKSDFLCGRIVSDGMLNKSGRVRFLLCNGKERVSVSAKNMEAHAQSEGFFNLKRYTLVEIENPEKRGDENNISWGIGAETKIRIIKTLEEL